MKTKLFFILTFFFSFYLSLGQTDSLKYLKLTTDQLKEIGFVINEHGVFFKSEVPERDNSKNIYKMICYFNNKYWSGTNMNLNIKVKSKKTSKTLKNYPDSLNFMNLPALKLDYFIIKIVEVKGDMICDIIYENINTIPVFIKQSDFDFSNKKDIIVYLKATKSLKNKLSYVDNLDGYIVKLLE